MSSTLHTTSPGSAAGPTIGCGDGPSGGAAACAASRRLPRSPQRRRLEPILLIAATGERREESGEGDANSEGVPEHPASRISRQGTRRMPHGSRIREFATTRRRPKRIPKRRTGRPTIGNTSDGILADAPGRHRQTEHTLAGGRFETAPGISAEPFDRIAHFWRTRPIASRRRCRVLEHALNGRPSRLLCAVATARDRELLSRRNGCRNAVLCPLRDVRRRDSVRTFGAWTPAALRREARN